MTSKVKCPVCNAELHTTADIFCVCTNDKCKIWGQPIPHLVVMQLIQSQKDLEIARKAADNSREKLAAFMHDTWGNWFAYQLKNSTVKNLQRWGIQSNTPYSSLTETDKDKDRKFADKIIEIIKEQITHDNSEKPNSHEHKE